MLSDFSYELTKRTIETLSDIDALRQFTLTLLDSNKHQSDLLKAWIYSDGFKELENRGRE